MSICRTSRKVLKLNKDRPSRNRFSGQILIKGATKLQSPMTPFGVFPDYFSLNHFLLCVRLAPVRPLTANENKKTVLDTYYKNNNYANIIKFMKITLNSTENRQKTQKAQNRFPKESVQNADLYKAVLEKIMSTHE